MDIRPENLLAVNYKQFNDRIVQQERVIQEFRVPDIHRIGMLASLEQTCKEISQYNAEGKRINAYKSTMEASRQTGISDSHIRNAARGIERTAGGYFWAYGNAESFDAEGFWKNATGVLKKSGEQKLRNMIWQAIALRSI